MEVSSMAVDGKASASNSPSANTPGGSLVSAVPPATPVGKAHRKFPVRALIPLILIAAFALWWFRFRQVPGPPNVIAVSGRIEGDDSSVASKPGGRVLEIRVREGDTVQAGQVIASTDDAQVRAREDQARDALQQAEAQVRVQQQQIAVLAQSLEQSRLAVGQANLDTSGKVSQAEQQILAADANILQAQANVRSARRKIAVLEQSLEQSHLEVDQSKQDAQGRVFQAEQQVAAAEALLAQTQAQYQQATADAKRSAYLVEQGAISQQSADQSETNAKSLSAGMASAQKQVEAARGALTIAQSNLTNPALKRSQEASVKEQIQEAQADLAATEAQVKQLQAVRKQAVSGLTATRADLANPAVRVSQEAAVREQITQAQASLAAAQATAKQARAKLAEAQADRKDLTVRAPFTGTIATRVAEPGEVLAPGATLVTMVDLSKVYLRGYIPEGQIGHVRIGQEARIYLDSSPKEPVTAFVSRIDPEASFTPENTYFKNDREVQVVGVKLQVKDAIGFAKPGMPADGEVLIEGNWPTGKHQ